MTATTRRAALIREIMTTDPVTLDQGDTMEEIARQLDSNGISGAPVVNTAGRVVGVVTKTDLVHRVLEGPAGGAGSFFELLTSGGGFPRSLDPADLGTVEDLMSADVVTARDDETVTAAAHRMAAAGVHRLIVVDAAQQPVGVVTAMDVLRVHP